jgi:NAD(P)-dependent dehydrogenase (short-subunit alcohol dehydrogenase family)
MKLQAKVALITGAATGIGRASALLFAREGAAVAIADINERDGTATAQAIRDAGGRALFIGCDLRRIADLQAAVQKTVAELGRLDVFFHNAGVAGPGALERTSEAEYDQLMDVHVKAGFFGAQAAVPHLRAAGAGSILFTASGLGLRPSRQSPAYSASKAALLMLARALAVSLADDNIRVNAICPGPIDSTPLWEGVLARNPGIDAVSYAEMNRKVRPLKRLGNADEMARAALFLVAPENSYITGVALPVDGGGAMS